MAVYNICACMYAGAHKHPGNGDYKNNGDTKANKHHIKHTDFYSDSIDMVKIRKHGSIAVAIVYDS